MTFSHEEEGDNVYTVTLKLSKEGIYHYSFRVFNEFGMWQYGRDEYMNAVCGENLPEWQLTVYKSSYKTPDFVKGGIIYHILSTASTGRTELWQTAATACTEAGTRIPKSWGRTANTARTTSSEGTLRA